MPLREGEFLAQAFTVSIRKPVAEEAFQNGRRLAIPLLRFWSERSTRKKQFTIGSTDQYRNKADAMSVVESFRLRINSDQPVHLRAITVGGLIQQYIAQELPQRSQTQRSYLAVLRRWIGPKWCNYEP